jgi:proton-dependent oligopeptide transporter, POT family
LSFQTRLQEIRTGFERSFWVANITELFERVSYYGTTAVLAIFLHEKLQLSVEQTAAILGIFGFVVWFLPVLGGTLADRFGFRKALLFAYGVMTVGYFLLGSLDRPFVAGVFPSITTYWRVLAILMIPALGPGLVKPCVAGTTARASTENVRSLGYSIYYTLVNVGGALGPLVGSITRNTLGIEAVFRVSALSVFLMFWVTLFFFHEPARSGEAKVGSIVTALRNLVVVLTNLRFVLFLLIFSGFWIVFWQEFISVPLFMRTYVDPNLNVDRYLSTGPIVVMSCTILMSFLTRKVPALRAMMLGVLVTGLGCIILAVDPTRIGLVACLVVIALGEIIQSPRYYEYISRLAPPGQQGLFMGYAFLPIAIGYFLAGKLSGLLLHHYGEVLHEPNLMWWWVTAVGVTTAILLFFYDKLLRPAETAKA